MIMNSSMESVRPLEQPAGVQIALNGVRQLDRDSELTFKKSEQVNFGIVHPYGAL